ncbi:MAG: flavin reductase family protein [Actinomycetota bacterium]
MTESSGAVAEVARDVMSRVAFGLEVVTLSDPDGVPRGMTISSLTQVSAEPPSVLVCLGPQASITRSLSPGQTFCVNVLASDQVDESYGFSYGTEDPFEAFDWSPAADGTPILSGTAAHLMCVVERVVDHHGSAVVLSKVVGGAVHKDETLVYWRKQYFSDLGPAVPGMRGTW